MRYKLITLFVVFSSLSPTFLFSQPANQKQSENEYIKQQYEFLKEQTKIIEEKNAEIVSQSSQERVSLLHFMEWAYKISAGILILGAALWGFLGWKDRKGFREEIERESKREIDEIKNSINIELSQVVEQSLEAVKELMDERMSDLDLKKGASICIFFPQGRKDDAESVRLQLINFGIRNVVLAQEVDIIKGLDPSAINKREEKVVFFYNPSKIENEYDAFLSVLNEAVTKLSLPKAFFYLGKGTFNYEKDNVNHIANACRSPSTLYQNLLDLLRYMKYKNM